jgi:hypothetical protein
MKEKLIAVRGDSKLFYTGDKKNEFGLTVRMGYITMGDSDSKMEVNIDQVLSRGYWEEPEQPAGA